MTSVLSHKTSSGERVKELRKDTVVVLFSNKEASINYITRKGGGGGRRSVTLCDEGGEILSFVMSQFC
jgi:hypothetical protein